MLHGFSIERRLANLFVFANLFGWERTPTPLPNSLFPTYSEVFHRAREAKPSLLVAGNRIDYSW
jgi:hypothetical protein